jgi:hypothetical protein
MNDKIIFLFRNDNYFYLDKYMDINSKENKNNNINFKEKMDNKLYEKLITTKEFFWIRKLYFPYIVNYRNILQKHDDIPMSYKKIFDKELLKIKKSFYNIINKGAINNNMFQWIDMKLFFSSIYNNVDNLANILNNVNTFKLNLIKKDINNYKKIIKKKIFDMNNINNELNSGNLLMSHFGGKKTYRTYNKNRKSEVVIERINKKLSTNKPATYSELNLFFSKNDQIILNKNIHDFLVKKKNIYEFKANKKNDIYFFHKKKYKIKKNKKIINTHAINRRHFNKNIVTNKPITYSNENRKNIVNVDHYDIKIDNSINIRENNIDIDIIDISKYMNELSYLKKNIYFKDNSFKIKKPTKYINLNIYSDIYVDRYLSNKKENDYLINLWIIRKQNRFLLEKKTQEYSSRFFEKKKLINKYCEENVYKELFIEYSRRVHSNDNLDNYERSFEKVGPLSFYYDVSEDIGNLKKGSNLLSNLLIDNNVYFHVKPLFNISESIAKIFINNFFLPMKMSYTSIGNNYNITNTRNNVNNNNNIKNKHLDHYYVYGQYNFINKKLMFN